jgi:hypothetical protein
MVARQSQNTFNSSGFEPIEYEPRGLHVSNFIGSSGLSGMHLSRVCCTFSHAFGSNWLARNACEHGGLTPPNTLGSSGLERIAREQGDLDD